MGDAHPTCRSQPGDVVGVRGSFLPQGIVAQSSEPMRPLRLMREGLKGTKTTPNSREYALEHMDKSLLDSAVEVFHREVSCRHVLLLATVNHKRGASSLVQRFVGLPGSPLHFFLFGAGAANQCSSSMCTECKTWFVELPHMRS